MLRRAVLGLLAVAALGTAPAAARPVAAISGPATAATGATVTFDAASSSGAIVAYDWDLDGTHAFATSTGASPKLTTSFAAAGQRVVSVRVTDGGGATSEASVEILVTQGTAPTPAPAPADGDTSGGGGTSSGDGGGTSSGADGGAGPAPDAPGGAPADGATTALAPLGGDISAGIAPLSVPAQSWVRVGSATRFAAINGAARRGLRTVRRNGLWVNLLTDRPARFVLDVLVPRAAARRLGLRGPAAGTRVRIARVRPAMAAAGQRAYRIALPARVRRALTAPMTVLVRGAATDRTGRKAAVARAFALRR